ncbi:M14 family zinc carboxypeptidase [uncultured Maribacter sp.]|uniref:M14 metallopeptidase family protein n=1 Tax=uncultured Maribacter sp. TaxID=431308 RepID=UPI00262EA42C|nr:M14 family zinc carboxypeptidase [uncultured Maribacter sp.]
MKKLLLALILFFSTFSFAQKLQSPSNFLGYKIGSHFSRHHQVIDYFKHVSTAAASNVKLVEYGKTNEKRPLVLAYISSKENIENLDNIRLEHLKKTTGSGTNNKAIVWLSYNVHGNESVGTEAAMQTIYELLTSKKTYLENTIIILDPCVNPDGRDRYVNWYNQYKNKYITIDPNSKEHHEDWWNGRSNHYMFDLNRDWAWLTQVESIQRLKFYNKWLPHIHVDFHEQGVDSPYYFAPAAEPYHEAITKFQRDFQTTIGKNHAKYFNKNGWLYFTKEVFDLLYPSYGDTYPTYNGSIGMTYEQGGSGRAGLAIKTYAGDILTLQDRYNHHLTTGISTIEVASKNEKKLNEEFKKFYETKNYKYNSYVLNGSEDKITALTKLLDQHQIQYQQGQNANLKGYLFNSSKTGTFKSTTNSLVVSTNQPKSTLVKVLFEPKTKLTDSLTYDITAWSLPYAYGLNAVATTAIAPSKTYEKSNLKTNSIDPNAYAYITDWNSIKDAKFLAAILQEKIKVRYSKNPFKIEGKTYNRGSLIITKLDNSNHKSFADKLGKIANTHEKKLFATKTGFVDSGKDFGSNSVQIISDTKVAILSGKPNSTLRFGEIWHFFEEQINYPISVLDADYFDAVNLSNYNILILPSGSNYSSFMTSKRVTAIHNWVENGGNLIVMGKALQSFINKQDFKIKKKTIVKDSIINPKSYERNEREKIKNAITGAIFKTKVDPTHPLSYGYNNTYFTLKLGNDAYEYLDEGNAVYLEKQNTKPVSGFAGSNAQKKVQNTLIYGTQSLKKGNITYMVDNPLFRGFWENGKLFFANAIFMVN